jgi:hypothetical protein
MFDSNADVIPSALDEMQPGPVLAGWLSAVDVDGLSGHDRVVVLRAHQRMASHYAAQVYGDMASVVDALADLNDNPYAAPEWAEAEIRAALQLTRRSAETELGFALDLRRRLPAVWALLACGDIDVRRAKVMVSATSHLPVAIAREVIDQVVEHAPHWTTGQLAARLRRLSIETDPGHAKDRYEQAVSERRVTTQPTEAGTTNLYAIDLPPDRVAAATHRINQIARSLRTAGEVRTMDQLRADVLLDLLEGTKAATSRKGGKGVVDIHVDLDTLTRLADHPGELAGYGPVIADIARRVAEQQTRAEWRFTVTDPDTGEPMHTGTTRRRPDAAQRRSVEAHHRTCVFPGCRMPAAACDIDHRVPWSEGGPTSHANLAPLCRHDHVIKTRSGWSYIRLCGGDHRWTSPLGRTYTTVGRPP